MRAHRISPPAYNPNDPPEWEWTCDYCKARSGPIFRTKIHALDAYDKHWDNCGLCPK